jgi:hypothetical protein
VWPIGAIAGRLPNAGPSIVGSPTENRHPQVRVLALPPNDDRVVVIACADCGEPLTAEEIGNGAELCYAYWEFKTT